MRSVDICIESVQFSTTEHHYRAPIKFAGVAVDRATILTVNIGVRSPSGKVVNGWGSMPLGNVWAFPSSVLTYQETLNALLSCVAQVAKAWEDLTDWGMALHTCEVICPPFLVMNLLQSIYGIT